MSLRNTPPPLTVVHGNECTNRYLVLGAEPRNTYTLNVMTLEYTASLGEEYILNVKSGTMGTVFKVGRWDFAHRETNCPNRKKKM